MSQKFYANVEENLKKKIFVIVLDKHGYFVKRHFRYLSEKSYQFVIITGKETELKDKRIIYRKPLGKYDAMNYSLNFIPKSVEYVVFLDCDVLEDKILPCVIAVRNMKLDFAFPRIKILDNKRQSYFTALLDKIRNTGLLITANGEMLIMRPKVINAIFPLKPCKAEDTLALLLAIKNGFKAGFLHNIEIKTIRPYTQEQEENYKRRVACGIYQALAIVKRIPFKIKLFYLFLPFLSVTLIVLGRTGILFVRGIIRGLCDYLRGDRNGTY